MSVLQDISKRLLVVASMPPEKRNDALMEVKIEIEGVQYNMVLEQKDLIMNIIDELIAENDADQIAKSKLVFVPDVEEQIAPTKKTRANKVVKPVVELIGEDLPDTFGRALPLKDLPLQIQKLVILRNIEQGNDVDFNKTLSQQMSWSKIPEKSNFWVKIAEGDLTQFKKKYGNKGEKVDKLIEDAQQTNYVELILKQNTSAQPVSSGDLPDKIGQEIPVRDLPEQVLKLASLRNKQEGKTSIDLDKTLMFSFIWDKTPEDEDFWSKIHFSGDLTEFKRKYGNKGEKVDEVIEFAGLTEFVEGLLKPVTSGDLPDTIPFASLIKNFPEPVKKLALKRQSEAGNIKNENINIVAPKSFDWVNTPEGEDFWDEIHKGNLEEFKRIFGSEGESVDNLVNGLVGFNELLEMANKQNAPAVSSGDLPDTIQYNPSLNDLPESVMKLALFRQKEQNLPFNDDVPLADTDAFSWISTPEGKVFWETIADGDLREFKRKYGNKGEKVDAIINPAPAVKTRKPRTPKAPAPAPVVAKQKLLFLRLIFNPPVGSAIKFEVYNPEELHYIVLGIFNKLNVVSLTFPFEAVSDFSSYLTNQKLYYHNEPSDMVDKLIEQFDTFVNPELDWSDFYNAKTDKDRIESNNEILFYAFQPAKVVTPKPVKVVAPKVSTPKPVKAVTPKAVKVVAPKVVKTKLTKPKAEDDLSFLNDLDNIF